ncbi:MAG: aminoacyl-tRNA hydrolase [Pseudomonadota bacterium]
MNKSTSGKGFATGEVILVVGLGNPGPKYAGNRHNIGFMALDQVASDAAFGPWRAKFDGEIAEGRLSGKRIVLLKPHTFMNESGLSVGKAANFLKIAAEDIIVIHDELDLAPGKCRVKVGGGHAGHNGLRSIHAHMGPDYARVRLGIGHPGDKNLVSSYVLRDFAKSDRDWLDPLIDGIADGFDRLVTGDDAGFQNAVALKRPPAPAKAKKGTPHQARAAASKAAKQREAVEKSLSAAPDNPLARLLQKFSKPR